MSSQSCFEKICSITNLKYAFYKASKRKRNSASYLYFRKNQEENLRSIQEELQNLSWHAGEYRQFEITDPKQRIITAAPFEDRIVHHAIVLVLEEFFEKKFIFHTYACRKGKGTHAAIEYARRFCRRGIFFLKLDIKKYFDSIDHDILKAQLRKVTHETKTQILLHRIIDSYDSGTTKKGLPIGNLTSQYFANLYLSGLDHFILEKMKPSGYVRYMDDMLIFSPSLKELKNIYRATDDFVREKLNLALKTPVFGRADCGIPFLGKLITKTQIKPLSEKMRGKRKKIKRIDFLVKSGKISEEKAAERITAILADAQVQQK